MLLVLDMYGPGIGEAAAAIQRRSPRATILPPIRTDRFPSLYRLFDLRTGEAAQPMGLPVTCLAEGADEARRTLLHNRDPRFFDVRIESPNFDADTRDAPYETNSDRAAAGPRSPSKESAVNLSYPVNRTAGFARSLRQGLSDFWSFSRFVAIAAIAVGASTAVPVKAESLLNVSYDPTRELYRAINEAFAAKWQADGNEAATIETSHGGSGAQARSVIEGLDAQVVTLALAADIDKIAKEGKLPADWQSKFPHNSSPYTSTIVFLVREGNPKGIKDWGDLLTDGVEVITPNPKTSGGARWNFLAAWAWAEKNGKDPQEFVKQLYTHVPVLDKGARDSTTTFAQRGIGDVLLAWENEAYLALNELGDDQFDIVVPSISILAEPPVAIVDANIHSDGQKKLAEAYLNFLYSPEGQAIIFKNYYRGWDTSKADPKDVDRFPQLQLATIADFGGWGDGQKKFFADGGVFDQIYTSK